MVTLTERAVQAALAHQEAQPESRGKALRIWIADKNCDGFIYGVSFDLPIEGDHTVQAGYLQVIIDAGTATYLTQSQVEVDYVESEDGRGFVVKNPDADRYRGKFFLKST